MCLLFGWNNIFKNINCDFEDIFNDIDKFLVKRGRNKDITKKIFQVFFLIVLLIMSLTFSIVSFVTGVFPLFIWDFHSLLKV